MSEPSDQLLPYNRFVSAIPFYFNYITVYSSLIIHSGFCSELVVIFLKLLYDQDPVGQLLEISRADQLIEIDL